MLLIESKIVLLCSSSYIDRSSADAFEKVTLNPKQHFQEAAVHKCSAIRLVSKIFQKSYGSNYDGVLLK